MLTCEGHCCEGNTRDGKGTRRDTFSSSSGESFVISFLSNLKRGDCVARFCNIGRAYSPGHRVPVLKQLSIPTSSWFLFFLVMTGDRRPFSNVSAESNISNSVGNSNERQACSRLGEKYEFPELLNQKT